MGLYSMPYYGCIFCISKWLRSFEYFQTEIVLYIVHRFFLDCFSHNNFLQSSDTNGNGNLLAADDKRNLASSQPFLHNIDNNEKKLTRRNSGQLDRIDALYTGSMHNISRHRSRASIKGSKMSINDLEKNVSKQDLQLMDVQEVEENEFEGDLKVCGCIPCSPEAKRALKGMLSLDLFRDPIFIIFLMSNFLTRYIFVSYTLF
jgi:MCP family monocarboxylic acid transporter-like MFS transporter 14